MYLLFTIIGLSYYYSILSFSVFMSKILYSNGFFFAYLYSRGNNALHMAVKEGHWEVVRVLLTESQINAEATNFKGWNPN